MSTYDPTQPRLLPDFAAVPTKAERAGTRRHWQRAQVDLFAVDAEPEPGPCPVCAGPHDDDPCPHGTAAALDLDGPPCAHDRAAPLTSGGIQCLDCAAVFADAADLDGPPQPDPAAVRAMFAGLGWSTTEPTEPSRAELERMSLDQLAEHIRTTEPAPAAEPEPEPDALEAAYRRLRRHLAHRRPMLAGPALDAFNVAALAAIEEAAG